MVVWSDVPRCQGCLIKLLPSEFWPCTRAVRIVRAQRFWNEFLSLKWNKTSHKYKYTVRILKHILEDSILLLFTEYRCYGNRGRDVRSTLKKTQIVVKIKLLWLANLSKNVFKINLIICRQITNDYKLKTWSVKVWIQKEPIYEGCQYLFYSKLRRYVEGTEQKMTLKLFDITRWTK